MGKKKGIDILISVNSHILGGQRNATLSRSTESMDATSKDSDGWEEKEIGLKNWSVDCDGLMVEDDAAFLALETAYMTNIKVDVEVAFKSGGKYTGKAIITDFPIEAPYDDLSTYSVSLEGDGKLEKITP